MSRQNNWVTQAEISTIWKNKEDSPDFTRVFHEFSTAVQPTL